MDQTLEYTVTVSAPQAEVFRAFTRATPLRDWLCDVALADARLGGRIYLWWNRGYYAAGEYTALEPERRVAFTWMGRNEPGRTEIDVRLEPNGQCTDVHLTHSGLGEGDGWARTRGELDLGWTAALQNLESLLETGQDLRYTRRPMFGVMLEEFNPQVATELGVPAVEGVRITNALPGMGAAEAGLRTNDILVTVDDQTVTDFPTLVNAIRGKRAGDSVQIGYYRGHDYHSAPMRLSGRWLPEIPSSPTELARAVHDLNQGLLSRLSQAMDGVSDAQANARPDGHEWSALEVIAHLVVSERETHMWLADMINDDERVSDRYTNASSVTARVDAAVAVYPTVDAMLKSLREALSETETMLALLPDETVARRGNYWRIGHNVLQNDNHWVEHVEQIGAALARARQAA